MKNQEILDSIKENVRSSQDYFKKNVARFNFYRSFVFNTTLTAEMKDKLSNLQKPAIESNTLEAYISRQLGEFSSQEPGIEVRAADGVPIDKITPELEKQIEVIAAHLRAILTKDDNNNLRYEIYKDLLSGGFSVVQIYTDYVGDRTFDQGVFVEKAYDPTMCGFDPLARKSHKGDGAFCYTLYPRTKEEFLQEFPNNSVAASKMKFRRQSGGKKSVFNWSYKQGSEEILVLCDYYEKKYKRVKIVELTDKQVMTKNQYDNMLEDWEEFSVPPEIMRERWSEEEVIWRYRICENEILEKVETDYKQFPLIFIDGNSIYLKESEEGMSHQMTRPMVYHAKDMQKIKNFALQTIANEIENMPMHRWVVANESLDKNYMDWVDDPQSASLVVYNAFKNGDPSQPLPAPREVARVPTPPLVNQAFLESDQTIQIILGTYDASLGINNNQLSGKAIQAGTMNSNAVTRPYITGFIDGLSRVAQVITDLIPLYYRTPRSIPVITREGRRSYQVINQKQNQQPQQGQQPQQPKEEESVFIDYQPNDLLVRVQAGVNYQLQKQIALESMIKIMQISPSFNEFVNQYGLEMLLDNLDIKGIDSLKAQADTYMKQKQQQQQQQQKYAMETNPAVLNYKASMASIQQKQKEAEMEQVSSMANVSVKSQEADTDFIEVISGVKSQHLQDEVKMEQVDAENKRSAVDLAINMSKHIVDSQE